MSRPLSSSAAASALQRAIVRAGPAIAVHELRGHTNAEAR